MKKCQRKQYNVHICIPPVGTAVIDKVTAPEFAAEVVKLGVQNKSMLILPEIYENNAALKALLSQGFTAGKCKAVMKGDCVVAGVEGDLSVDTLGSVAAIYNFADGTPINPVTLNTKFPNATVVDWFVAQCKGSELPEEQADFVNGKMQVLTGNTGTIMSKERFLTMYNKRGWSELGNVKELPPINIADLPPVGTGTKTVIKTAKRRVVKVGKISEKIANWTELYKIAIHDAMLTKSAVELEEIAKQYAAVLIIGRMFKDNPDVPKSIKNLKDLASAETSQTIDADTERLCKTIAADVIADKIMPGAPISYSGVDDGVESKVISVAQSLDTYAEGINIYNLDNMSVDKKIEVVTKLVNAGPCFIIQNGAKEITAFIGTKNKAELNKYYNLTTLNAIKILKLYEGAAKVKEAGQYRDIQAKTQNNNIKVSSLALRLKDVKKVDKKTGAETNTIEISSTSYTVKPENVLVIGALQGLDKNWSARFNQQLGAAVTDMNKLMMLNMDVTKFKALMQRIEQGTGTGTYDIALHSICPELNLNPKEDKDVYLDAYYTSLAKAMVTGQPVDPMIEQKFKELWA